MFVPPQTAQKIPPTHSVDANLRPVLISGAGITAPYTVAVLAAASVRRVTAASSGVLQKSDTRQQSVDRPPTLPAHQCRTGTDPVTTDVTRHSRPARRPPDRPAEFSFGARITAEDPDLRPSRIFEPPGESPHKIAQGKLRKLMNPEPWMRFHPFVATLEQWSDGVPVVCSPPWSPVAIETAVARGPHTSALTPEARQLITEEMEYQVAAGFSEIMLWSDVQALQPEHLKVSPLAVIPQVGRRGRLLLDLSFAVQAPAAGGKRARRANRPTEPSHRL
ncbi:hypothetical protein MHU86_8255 [Fragilaria crotonensis]|nr:hypothetical protein MHU86_8255 [Fragilaria crotonensis]